MLQAARAIRAAAGCRLGFAGPECGDHDPADSRPCFARSRKTYNVKRTAFTLLELLIVTAMVAVLLAIAAPSLSKARIGARNAVSLSNLRSHVQVITSYANDYSDFFPYLTVPNAQYSVIRGGGIAILGDYFVASSAWNIGLADGYYDGNALNASFYDPDDPDGVTGLEGSHPVFSTYRYSCTLFTLPEFWSATTRKSGHSQWLPVRAASVTAPSAKALLSSFFPYIREAHAGVPEENRSYSVGLVDGAATSLSLRQVTPQYPTGDCLSGATRPGHTYWMLPGLHTQNGVRGRDIR